MRILVLGLCLLVPTGAFAQGPVNPTQIEWDHPDFEAVEGYVLGYFATEGAAAPVQEVAVPKPTSCTPCEGPLVSRPISFQTWYVAMRATWAEGNRSTPWSARVPFERAPSTPTIRRVR